MANPNVQFEGLITKADVAKKVVYGWAYVSEEDGQATVDHSGDTWSPEELVKTAHDFVIECRVGGADHIQKDVSTLVESVVFTKEVQDALGIDLGKIGWFVGFRIEDDEILKRVESGELMMFSIGGSGLREEL